MKELMRFIFVLVATFLLVPVVSEASQTSPESYIALEVNSGRVMYSHDAEKVRPMAGLSQVATALVTLDWVARNRVPLNRIVTVPNSAAKVLGANPMNLAPGDKITLRDALYSTLLGSDNVAASSIAHLVGSDISRSRQGDAPVKEFVTEMNLLADALGMTNTKFRSPHGLDYNDVSTTTAADLALLGIYAMRNDAFSFIVSQPNRRIGVETQVGTKFYNVKNSNPLLKDTGVDGIKTGKSRAAGECIMLGVKRDTVRRLDPYTGREAMYPQRMVVVVLGSPERFSLARELVKEGWREYDSWLSHNQPRIDGEKRFLHIKGTH